MAIEDGIVLATCVRDVPELPDALATYERLRRERVERVVAQGKRNGDNKAVGPIARLLRDHVIFPIVMKRQATQVNDAATDWLRGYRIDWDAPLAGVAARGSGGAGA